MEYKKKHKKREALINHAEKISSRGGKYKIDGMTIVYSFDGKADLSERFFKIIHSNKWKHDQPKFVYADNHKIAIESIDKKTKRVMNTRFREIERTGNFYFVEEQKKNGKTLIFEKL
jgi:hypothetical protein